MKIYVIWRKEQSLFLLVVCLMMALCGCAASQGQRRAGSNGSVLDPTSTRQPKATFTPLPTETDTPRMTQTATRTVTPLVTYTPWPTYTMWPTATPWPTHTLYPTQTPWPTYTMLPVMAQVPTDEVQRSSVVDLSAPTVAQEPTPFPAPTLAPTDPPVSSGGCAYIGNKNSKVFHHASCSSVKQMSEGNRVCFGSREEAIAAGYRPCGRCKP